jgi:tRNA(Arg) A34 adenosine deaminase TadA
MQANLALKNNEVPVGCIIVDHTGAIIGHGYNAPIMLNDPTAHAEVQSLRQACLHRKNYRLKDVTVYVTLEPCLMCVGAFLHARIDKLIIATRDTRNNSIHQHVNLFQSKYFNHQIKVEYGCLEEEAKALLDQFFRERR